MPVSNPTRLLGFETPSGNNSAGPITTSSVSPSGNALVVLWVFGNYNPSTLSVTSTFSTVSGWTVSGWIDQSQCSIGVAWAITTASPGSGTISASNSTGFYASRVLVEQIASGFDTSTTVGAVITGANGTISSANDLTPSGTFSATPASGSLLLGGINVRTTSGSSGSFSLAPESGLTAVGANDDEWQNKKATAYGAGSHGSAMGWVADTGTDRASIVGIEILAFASAATLSSPTSASVTQTGATIGATTDDNTGTLYGVVTTSATAPSATQIKAGQDHTGSAAAGSGSNASLTASVNNTIAITGLTAATSYYYYLVQDNGSDSNVVNGTFTTAVAAPTLTSPTAVSIGTTTVTPRVTTDTGNGTCYYVITPQAEGEPSNTQVEAGQNAAGGAPVASGSTVVSGTPPVVVTFSEVTGLTAGTAYRISYAHSGTPS